MSERTCRKCDCLIGSGTYCGPCDTVEWDYKETRCKGCNTETKGEYCDTCKATRYQ